MDVSCFIDESIVDPKKIEEMMCKFNNNYKRYSQ